MLGTLGPYGVPPHQLAHWSVFSQEDVLNTQCGYDVRLKLVRGVGTDLRALGREGQPPISSSERPQGLWGIMGEGVLSPRNHPGT